MGTHPDVTLLMASIDARVRAQIEQETTFWENDRAVDSLILVFISPDGNWNEHGLMIFPFFAIL